MQEAALAQRDEGLEADVDLVADQHQAGRRVRILDVREQRLELVGLDLVDPLADDQPALRHHRQRARGRERRAEPLSFRSKTSWLKAAAAPAAASTAVRIAAWRGVDQVALARQAVDRVDLAARDRAGDVDVGLLRRPGHVIRCTTRRALTGPMDPPRGILGRAATAPTRMIARADVARPARWYDRAQRDLPWRRDPSPYKTLVSEFMLQQTVVATVVPYFERFLARFPDVGALAAASDDDVTALWSGLGYYARARNLQRAAAAIVERHGGALPATEEELRALPGIGPYTAAAVAAIAFGARTFALDGNAARVIGAPVGRASTHRCARDARGAARARAGGGAARRARATSTRP